MNILQKPIITERSLSQAKIGLYTFAVNLHTTKLKIKKEVEEQFKVNVESVRTITLKTKTKKVGKLFRTKEGKHWKKAIVKVKKGQKIPLFEVST